MTQRSEKSRAPAAHLLVAELRSLFETPLGLFAELARSPQKSAGRAVMLIPGFLTRDQTLWPLTRALRRAGHHPVGWEQGRNKGLNRDNYAGMTTTLERQAATHGAVTLVGWSLGGVFARELARARPDLVQQVITLGSPISGHPNANNMTQLFAKVSGKPADAPIDWEAFNARAATPPVPCTAILSRSDGIVSPASSLELGPGAGAGDGTFENIAVPSSHFGLPFNPVVQAVILDRLAQAADDWRPFRPGKGWARFAKPVTPADILSSG